jgi:hypothetical protein
MSMTTDEPVESLVRGRHTMDPDPQCHRCPYSFRPKSGWHNRLPIGAGSIVNSTILLPEPRRGRRLIQKFSVAAVIEAGIGKKSVDNPFPKRS